MSYKYSESSKEKLATCHPDLQKIFNKVIEIHDCTILCGYRNKADQDAAFMKGVSNLRWPDSNHNQKPSRAVDAALYPVDWNNRDRFIYFAGVVKGVAASMGIKIRCGIDFNQDLNFKNDKLFDGPHFELV